MSNRLPPLLEGAGSQALIDQIAAEEGAEQAKMRKRGTRKRRGSVSAPPTEEINVDLKLRYFEKDAETLAFLQRTLASNFIFQEVKGQDSVALANAFQAMHHPAGFALMKQGDDGDNFYCLRSGTVDIFVNPAGGGDPICVLTLEDAGYFGELALMYHCPRAATVVCRTPCTLEALDGTSFHTVLRRSGQNRRLTYHSFLKEVPLLQSLAPDQIGKLADVLLQTAFEDGEYIITQGDVDAENFYMLYEGRANAILDQHAGPSMQVKSYARGDYFGELALIKNHPRAANVVADQACSCVSIDRASFVRLLGAQTDDMQRHSSTEYSSTGVVVAKPPPTPTNAPNLNLNGGPLLGPGAPLAAGSGEVGSTPDTEEMMGERDSGATVTVTPQPDRGSRRPPDLQAHARALKGESEPGHGDPAPDPEHQQATLAWPAPDAKPASEVAGKAVDSGWTSDPGSLNVKPGQPVKREDPGRVPCTPEEVTRGAGLGGAHGALAGGPVAVSNEGSGPAGETERTRKKGSACSSCCVVS